MNKTCEIRVKTFQRFSVIEWTPSSVTTRCEIPEYANAVEIAKALVAARSAAGVDANFVDMVDGEDGNFVIVQALCYVPETIAYYAQTKSDARKVKAEAEAKHGGEFRIYRAESVL